MTLKKYDGNRNHCVPFRFLTPTSGMQSASTTPKQERMEKNKYPAYGCECCSPAFSTTSPSLLPRPCAKICNAFNPAVAIPIFSGGCLATASVRHGASQTAPTPIRTVIKQAEMPIRDSFMGARNGIDSELMATKVKNNPICNVRLTVVHSSSFGKINCATVQEAESDAANQDV